MAISIQSFLCLHSKYTIKFVASREIITVMNKKMSMMSLSEEKFLLVFNFTSVLSSFSCKSKISLLLV